MNIHSRQEVPVKSFSISAYICQKDDSGGRFLLIRRTSRYLHGTWRQVSGLVEPGEKAWEAALREIREETGLVPDAFYSADFTERFYEVEQNTISLVPVVVGFVDADASVRLSHKHSNYMWVASTRDERLPALLTAERVGRPYSAHVPGQRAKQAAED